MDGPRRTCVGCRGIRTKSDLWRIVRLGDGSAALDPAGTAPGRGAYVCGSACLDRGRGKLARALRARRMDVDAVAAQVAAVERESV